MIKNEKGEWIHPEPIRESIDNELNNLSLVQCESMVYLFAAMKALSEKYPSRYFTIEEIYAEILVDYLAAIWNVKEFTVDNLRKLFDSVSQRINKSKNSNEEYTFRYPANANMATLKSFYQENIISNLLG